MNAPPIPEELKGTEKRATELVYAAGPGSVVYAIPLAVAEQYVCEDEHPPIPTHAELAAASESGGDAEGEVEGHHGARLRDGSWGYHSDWAVGSYIWWQNGCSYYGLHFHPNWTSPLACDLDG